MNELDSAIKGIAMSVIDYTGIGITNLWSISGIRSGSNEIFLFYESPGY